MRCLYLPKKTRKGLVTKECDVRPGEAYYWKIYDACVFKRIGDDRQQYYDKECTHRTIGGLFRDLWKLPIEQIDTPVVIL